MTYKQLFYLITLLFCFNLINAQNGYIISYNNDTIEGEIDYLDPNGHFRDHIKYQFYDENKKLKTRKITANEIKGFKSGDEVLYSMELKDSYYFGSSSHKIFVKKVLDGKMELYMRKVFYSSARYGGHKSGSLKTIYFYKKESDRYLRSSEMNKKDLKEYFDDCKELLRLFSNKKNSLKDPLKITEIYNNSFTKKSKNVISRN